MSNGGSTAAFVHLQFVEGAFLGVMHQLAICYATN